MNNKNWLSNATAASKSEMSKALTAEKTKAQAVAVAKSVLAASTAKSKGSLKGTETSFGHPGHLALCRNVADGDMAAGILLFRILGLWKLEGMKRMQRFGREWIAMPRIDWARSAGLSDSEMKDRALPRLKKSCCAFLEVRTMRITPSSTNLLWISLDPEAMMDYVTPWDMYEPMLNGLGVFTPVPKYPYKDA